MTNPLKSTRSKSACELKIRFEWGDEDITSARERPARDLFVMRIVEMESSWFWFLWVRYLRPDFRMQCARIVLMTMQDAQRTRSYWVSLLILPTCEWQLNPIPREVDAKVISGFLPYTDECSSATHPPCLALKSSFPSELNASSHPTKLRR